MSNRISESDLDQIFREARTYRGSAQAWHDRGVDDDLLRQAYDLAKLGPTSANCQPLRVVFVRSPEAREKLRSVLSADNVAQTIGAPVTAIVAADHAFVDHLPRLYKEADAVPWFAGKPAAIEATASRNATLQGAYLIIALRSLGLDCGPMSGFNNAKLDQAFFAGTAIKSDFLINIGYGNPVVLNPRDERFAFDEACRIV
ncbi:MAG: malonic semialdehyde reductase [Dokdonella sp.]